MVSSYTWVLHVFLWRYTYEVITIKSKFRKCLHLCTLWKSQMNILDLFWGMHIFAPFSDSKCNETGNLVNSLPLCHFATHLTGFFCQMQSMAFKFSLPIFWITSVFVRGFPPVLQSEWSGLKMCNRVQLHLECPWISKKNSRPWKSWKLQSVLESPWISVLTLSNPDSRVPKRSKYRKTFRIKLLMLWKNWKRHRLKALFCTEWSSWTIIIVYSTFLHHKLNYKAVHWLHTNTSELRYVNITVNVKTYHISLF